ncbi:MAG: PKD domain-containing protein [Anaerolinea sp.]|nr:PKD domain-containing protein [Anaerolinea sp.]
MKVRFTIILPFMLGFMLLSVVWLTLAQEQETAVTSVLPGSTLYKQLGGFARAVAQQGDYVYLGIGSRLDVYDVQDPANPTLLAQTAPLTDMIISLDLLGNYVVAAASYGLYIFDMSTPSSPHLIHQYPLPSRVIYDVEISGTLVFVAEGRNFNLVNAGGGLRVLDLSDPLHPTPLGTYGDGDTIRSLSLYSHYAYLGYCDYVEEFICINKFAVLDVANPAALIEVSSSDDLQTTDMAIYDHYLYRGFSGFGVGIYDLTNPSAPTYVSTAASIPINFAQIQTSGDKLYVAGTTTLWVYDLSSPTDPSYYGAYNPAVVGPRAIVTTGNTAYLAYGLGGLRIIDVAQDTLPEIGVYNQFGSPLDAEAANNYLYVLDQNRNLHVVEVTDPANPAIVARYQHSARSEILPGDNDLFLSGGSGFEIISIVNPFTPTLRSNYATSGTPVVGMQVQGNYAFLAKMNFQVDTLEVVDITDRDQPLFVASVGTPCHYGEALQLVGNYIFLSEGDACSQHGRLTVVDVQSPTQPQIVATQPISYDAGPIAYINGYIYMGNYGVQIIDVTDPLNPTFSGRYTMTNTTNFGYEVTAVDGYLYVKAYDTLMRPIKRILDVSNPTAPVEVGDYLYVHGIPLPVGDALYQYAPASEDGLLIYLENNTPPQVDAGDAMTAVEGDELTFSGIMTGSGILMTGIHWDFGDGNTAVGVLSPTHAYGDNGVFTATLTITNIGGLSDSDTVMVTVTNAAPGVNAGANMTQTVNGLLTFAGSFTDPGYLDTHTITWDFGNAHIITGTLTPTHEYALPGVYTVTLMVIDDDGGIGSDTLLVTVHTDAIMVYLPVIMRAP